MNTAQAIGHWLHVWVHPLMKFSYRRFKVEMSPLIMLGYYSVSKCVKPFVEAGNVCHSGVYLHHN